jgi:hypothetical protein
MQGTDYINRTNDIVDCWRRARDQAVEHATELNQRQVTKQLANRLLEPFMYHTILVTFTEGENFFALRCPQYAYNEYSIYDELEKTTLYRSRKDLIAAEGGTGKVYIHANDTAPHRKRGAWTDTFEDVDWLYLNKSGADIHISRMAECMWDALNESTPVDLKAGEWHIPFSDQMVFDNDDLIYGPLVRVKVATAMCARVSYTVIGEEGKPPNYANDIKLHDRLAASGHWSPFEHCARVMNAVELAQYTRTQPSRYVDPNMPSYDVSQGWSGNFQGFIQYRKLFNNENITK